MSKLMKLCIMHAAVVLVLTIAVLFVNKIMIIPLRTQFQEAHTRIEKLDSVLVEKNKKLADAKAAVVKDLQIDEVTLLVEYISKHTDNLTKLMINDAAKALVEASWNNKVPLPLVVGIAQSVTGFNTTYSTKNNRGIMAISEWYVKESKQKAVYFNKVTNGAQAGCIELSKVLDKYSPVSSAITNYLNGSKLKNLDGVFKCAANFDKFRYKKCRAHLKSLVVPDYSKQE